MAVFAIFRDKLVKSRILLCKQGVEKVGDTRAIRAYSPHTNGMLSEWQRMKRFRRHSETGRRRPVRTPWARSTRGKRGILDQVKHMGCKAVMEIGRTILRERLVQNACEENVSGSVSDREQQMSLFPRSGTHAACWPREAAAGTPRSRPL
jgi:hypothetical protein